MTNRYRFRNQGTAIAKLTKSISNFGFSGTLTVYDADVTMLSSYRKVLRGKDKICYTVGINDSNLHCIFGPKVDIIDENGNLKKIKSKRIKHLRTFK